MNFGLSSSPLTRSLVWAKVTAMAHSAVTASSGRAVFTSTTPACRPISIHASAVVPVGRAQERTQNTMNSPSRAAMPSAMAMSKQAEVSSVATETAS